MELNTLIAHYRKALLIKPDNATVYKQLAELYYQQGKTEEALAASQQALQIQPDLAGVSPALENLVREQGGAQIHQHSEVNGAAREYIGSNYTIFWSESNQENRIGIYAMGGCDTPVIFACVPIIKPILQGTCCILREGWLANSRSDILLQSLQNYPQDLLQPVFLKLQLTPKFLQPHLFTKNFTVFGSEGTQEFPKKVIILSIAADVQRVVYQHREHGFLVDPASWWADQTMDLVLEDLSVASWFRKNFVSLGKISVEAFAKNFTQLIKLLKQNTEAHILVFNLLAVDPGKLTHNYQLVKKSQTVRRREFNLALVELSRQLDFSIIDIDRILKKHGVGSMLDFAHFPVELYKPIALEIVGIMRELAVF